MIIKSLRLCAFFLVAVHVPVLCMDYYGQAINQSSIAPFSPSALELPEDMPNMPHVGTSTADLSLQSIVAPTLLNTGHAHAQANHIPAITYLLCSTLKMAKEHSIQNKMPPHQAQQFICDTVTKQLETYLRLNPQVHFDLTRQSHLYATRESIEAAQKRIQLITYAQQQLTQDLRNTLISMHDRDQRNPLQPTEYAAALMRDYSQRITQTITQVLDRAYQPAHH